MTSIDDKKAQRFQFLKNVYDRTGAKRLEIVNMGDVGEDRGWPQEMTDAVTDYLVGEGLIKFWTIGGGIGITHQGVKEVERALDNPNQSTTYFPPVQYIM